MAKYQAGQSGNPAGRPRGRQDKRHALRELLEPHAPALVEKVVALALSGDPAALRMCLDRLIPPLRSCTLSRRLNFGGGSLTEQGTAILALVDDGDIAPDVANDLLAALSSLSAIRAADDIERRVGVLEGHYAQSNEAS